MGAKLLIIDHNDSFTYNLVGLFERIPQVEELSVWNVSQLEEHLKQRTLQSFDAVILSPGPGLPLDYPCVPKLLDQCFHGESPIPVLGICLGLQTLITYFGGRLQNLHEIQHGRPVSLNTQNKLPAIFQGLKSPIKVGLYHSWAADLSYSLDSFEILATAQVSTDTTIVMAIKHKRLPVYGLQFHPESYMTPEGEQMLQNWLQLTITTK